MRTCPRSLALAAAAVVLAATALPAQALGREAAVSLLAVRLQPMRADRSLPDSLRSLPLDTLLAPHNTNYAGWLDDAGMQRYVRLLGELAHQLPAAECGTLLDPGTNGRKDADALLLYGDTGLLTEFAGVLELIVRARALGHAQGRTAERGEMQATIMLAIGRMSVEDQTRLITIARNPPPTPEDGCWSVQQIFTMLGGLPADTLGPAARAMFGGAVGR